MYDKYHIFPNFLYISENFVVPKESFSDFLENVLVSKNKHYLPQKNNLKLNIAAPKINIDETSPLRFKKGSNSISNSYKNSPTVDHTESLFNINHKNLSRTGTPNSRFKKNSQKILQVEHT